MFGHSFLETRKARLLSHRQCYDTISCSLRENNSKQGFTAIKRKSLRHKRLPVNQFRAFTEPKLTRPQSSLNALRQRGLTMQHGLRMVWEREGCWEGEKLFPSALSCLTRKTPQDDWGRVRSRS